MGRVIHEDSLFHPEIENEERLKKEKEYLEYINEHVHNVQITYVKLMRPLLGKVNICDTVSDDDLYLAIEELKVKVAVHDASKYGDDEFDGYRAKYHPTAAEIAADDVYHQLVNERYEKCWEHHYKNNDHHPQYWYDFETKTPQDMSLDAILHMICDWEAMSMKFGGSTLKWWEEEKSDKEKYLTGKTLQILEDLLYNVFFG